MAGKLKITLIKSTIGANPKQKKIVEAMGFKKLYHSVEMKDCEATRGAIGKIAHMVKVEEI